MSQRAILQTCLLLLFIVISALACDPINGSIEENEYTLKKQFDLPDDLAETSGIIIYDSLLWTINDGGDEAAIYAVDLVEGNIVRTVYLAQKENKDWEDIAQDDNFIYIGDFGNNTGDRDDLVIYKIAKSILTHEVEQVVHPIEIFFRYEDQTDFSMGENETSFDCEAFIVEGDSLILFSKDWVNNHTTIYRIPKFQGTFVAKNSGRFNSNGLVTGADRTSGEIVICGYNGYIPFVTSIHHGDTLSISGAPRHYIQLYDQVGYQIEGIAFFNEKIYLTAERSATIQACWEFIEQ
jgi:hypothetical protein